MFCFNLKYCFIYQVNYFPPNLSSTLIWESCKRRALHLWIISETKVNAFLISVIPKRIGNLSKVSVSVLRHLGKMPSTSYNGENGYLLLVSGLEIDWDILTAIINIRRWDIWEESMNRMLNWSYWWYTTCSLWANTCKKINISIISFKSIT